MNHLLKSLVACFALASSLSAATLTINWDNTSMATGLKNSDNSTLLTKGIDTTNGDGALIQLGYYSNATAGDNFNGTWNALTTTTSIGDTGDRLGGWSAGQFSFFTTFNDASPTQSTTFSGDVGAFTNTISSFSSLSAGKVLSIRYYNATSVGTSTYYGAVSSNSWTWATPANNTLNFSLPSNGSGLFWEGGYNNYTGIAIAAVPEPSTYLLIGLALAGFIISSSRRKISARANR